MKIPLAHKLRPKTLDEIVGQEHLLGKGKALRKLIDADKLSSCILTGPPGIGKTTIGEVIALQTKSTFTKLNATNATVKDLRKAADTAKKLDKTNILYVDECLTYDSMVITRNAGKITIIPIGLIVEGNIECEALSYNIEKDIYEWKEIISRSVSKPKDYVEITVADQDIEITLKCSLDHEVLTNNGYKQAQHLKEGDEVISPMTNSKDSEIWESIMDYFSTTAK